MNNVKTPGRRRVTLSDFNCNICNGPLNYVQILNDDIRIQEDFFECKNCGKRIESKFLREEDIPEFYD